MSAALTTLLGAVGAVGAILAVLVPLLLAQGRRMDRFEARIDTRFEALTGDMAEVRRDLHALAERVTRVEAGIGALDARTARLEAATLAYGDRVARIEGAMSGPWRPPSNGSPAPPASTPPESARGTSGHPE